MGPRLHIKIPFIPPQYSGFAECALSHNYQEKEEEFFLTHSNITPKKILSLQDVLSFSLFEMITRIV